MLRLMLRLFGERAFQKAINTKTGRSPLDIKFGIALLRDRRIPFKAKLLSLGMGIGLVVLLVALQVPIEAVATFLAPILLPLDFAIDGLELVALPVLLMAILIAHVAPHALVDAIYTERVTGQPVHTADTALDVESYDPNTVKHVQTAAQTPAASQVLYAGSRRS